MKACRNIVKLFWFISCLDTRVSAVSQVSNIFTMSESRLVSTKAEMSRLVSCLDTSVLANVSTPSLRGRPCRPRAGLRHRPTRPWPIGARARGFRGPALSKVKEMCRHSYSLSHEKSETCFGLLPVLCIRVCLLKREAVVTVASHVTPAFILGYRAPQSFNPALCRSYVA